jgi:carbonic anhydrase
MASSYQEIFEYNEKWIVEKTATNPNYFHNLSIEQKPDYLLLAALIVVWIRILLPA